MKKMMDKDMDEELERVITENENVRTARNAGTSRGLGDGVNREHPKVSKIHKNM